LWKTKLSMGANELPSEYEIVNFMREYAKEKKEANKDYLKKL
jgi:hypothetical protein